jgi:integrase
MAAKVKVQDKSENNIDPFSKKEMDAIVQAFADHPVYNHYTNFVKFLFLTGCRSSEAVGLKWKHISADCQIITFCEAVVNVSSKGIRKNTKTGKSRKFPCNLQLQKLLLNIRPSDMRVKI